jgi:hypothetical protein
MVKGGGLMGLALYCEGAKGSDIGVLEAMQGPRVRSDRD